MRFESRFRIQKWLIEHGPINWLARVVVWGWEKTVPRSEGFGKFRENDPTPEEIEQYRDAKAKAAYGIFEPLKPEQHAVIAAAEPVQRGAVVETLLPGKDGDNDGVINRIAKEHSIPLPIVNTFAAISDPKNARLFSKEAAIKAFRKVGDGSPTPHNDADDVAIFDKQKEQREELKIIAISVAAMLVAVAIISGVITLLYEVLKRQ